MSTGNEFGESLTPSNLERINSLAKDYAVIRVKLDDADCYDAMSPYAEFLDRPNEEKPTDQEIEELKRQKESLETTIAEEFGLTDPLDKRAVFKAFESLFPDFQVGYLGIAESPLNEATVDIWGEDYEYDWLMTIKGLVILAKKTGITFKLNSGREGEFDDISSTTPIPKNIRPEPYEWNQWPEVAALANKLDKYVYNFYYDQYQARDPQLYERFKGISERLEACKGQPIVVIQECSDTLKVDMGYVRNSQLQVNLSGGYPTKFGNVSAEVYGIFWYFLDKKNPSELISYISGGSAGLEESSIPIEKLRTFKNKRENSGERLLHLAIGDLEIEKLIEQHPQYASAINNLFKQYQRRRFKNKLGSLGITAR